MSSNGSPVARWLNTFVNNSNISKEYVDIFKKFGYETLNEICTLDIDKLINMGIAQVDSNKIMQNVSVLRQTLQAGAISYKASIQQNHPNPIQMVTIDSLKSASAIQDNEKPTSAKKIKITRKERARSETKTRRKFNNSITTSKQTKLATPVEPTKLNNQTLANDSDVTYSPILFEHSSYYPSQAHQCFDNNNNATYNSNKRSLSTQNRFLKYNNSPEWPNQDQYPHYNAPEALNSHAFNQRSTRQFDPNYTSSDAVQTSFPFYSSKNTRIPDISIPNFNSGNLCKQANKNSSTPLQYLERLVKLPQSEIVDPKSIIVEKISLDSIMGNEQRSNGEQENVTAEKRSINSHIPDTIPINNEFDALNQTISSSMDNFKSAYCNKNKLNEVSFASNGNVSNMSNKHINGAFGSNPNQIANKNMNNSDSPSSSCSSMSITSCTSSSLMPYSSQYRAEQEIVPFSRLVNCQKPSINNNQYKNDSNMDFNEHLTNLIDTNNFELLDCLPELNSSIIEQLIDESSLNNESASCRENLGSSLVMNNLYSSNPNGQKLITHEKEQPTYSYPQLNTIFR